MQEYSYLKLSDKRILEMPFRGKVDEPKDRTGQSCPTHFATLPQLFIIFLRDTLKHTPVTAPHIISLDVNQLTGVTGGAGAYPDCLGWRRGCILNMLSVFHWATYREKQPPTLTFSPIANSEVKFMSAHVIWPEPRSCFVARPISRDSRWYFHFCITKTVHRCHTSL